MEKGEVVLALELATRWNFNDARNRCITLLEKMDIAPAEKLALAQRFCVRAWLESEFDRLVDRDEPLSFSEAKAIGSDMATLIAMFRETLLTELLKAVLCAIVSDTQTTEAEVESEVCEDIGRQIRESDSPGSNDLASALEKDIKTETTTAGEVSTSFSVLQGSVAQTAEAEVESEVCEDIGRRIRESDSPGSNDLAFALEKDIKTETTTAGEVSTSFSVLQDEGTEKAGESKSETSIVVQEHTQAPDLAALRREAFQAELEEEYKRALFEAAAAKVVLCQKEMELSQEAYEAALRNLSLLKMESVTDLSGGD